MNVIISNKNKMLLQNLGIDVIKEMDGEFNVEDIISNFQNFFYQRMILDITAIKNYTDIVNLQKLSISLDMNKIILLLDGTEATANPTFISNLVSMGIYNFAKNMEGIQYLYNSPNSYRDVAQYHMLNSNLNLQSNNQKAVDNSNQNVPAQTYQNTVNEQPITRIIGVKNVTRQSGATSLIYMMKKELSKNYNVVAVEVDKSDFLYFKDRDMISTITGEFGMTLNKYKNKQIILVDINSSMVAEGFCDEVLYLIEPSILKLEKLVALNLAALQGLKGKKVILNQSMLDKNEVSNFEYESKLNIFYNLPPLDERDKKISELNKMLVKLGFDKQQSEI